MPAASLLKFHVSHKKPQKDAPIGAMNSAALRSCHAFSENLHLIHTSAEVLKTLYLALCVQCIVRNPHENNFQLKIWGL